MQKLAYRDGRYWLGEDPLFVAAAEYQYYRDRRSNWRARLQQLKEAHCNTITFYVPWRHHLVAADPATGAQEFDFTGATRDNRDLAGFLLACDELGLFTLAKPGPFVHSELNIGGLPDVASPTFNPAILPVRKADGSAARWSYDDAILPSSEDPAFDALARAWLRAAGAVLRPHAYPAGRLIGIQLNDETLYCTSNDAPWNFGYDAASLARYRALLAEKYGDIAAYNTRVGTQYAGFAEVPPPARPSPAHPIRSEGQAAQLADWGEFQWRVRRDSYARYRAELGVNLPHLTNYAGITPPIEENVPGKEHERAATDAFSRLYPEWWLAQNRVEPDLDVHEYGMISWLGVAAYNIPNPRDVDRARDCSVNEVFCRYINTARRRRGLNMEENWGFATLYHPFSRHPMVPFHQTLASVAGGCTGYVVFCGVQHDYWDDSLDRMTKRQHPTFPSDAPITAEGGLTPMYEAMRMMNAWFEREGRRFLATECPADVTWLSYAPYAAISSWVPTAGAAAENPYWAVPGLQVPRAGREGFEELSYQAQPLGYALDVVDLESVTAEDLARRRVCALNLGYFMGAGAQRRLADFVEGGGTLIARGDVPRFDERGEPCRELGQRLRLFNLCGAVAASGPPRAVGRGRVLWQPPGYLAALRGAGHAPRVSHDGNMRAFVYGDSDSAVGAYVWFFGFDTGPGPHRRSVTWNGERLDLELGSKTAGVVALRGGRVASALVKGVNEVEGLASPTAITYRGQRWAGEGDWLRFSED